MKVVVLQSNYIPWRGYFDLINDADLFIFYDEVQYTKNDWRNRNKIYSKNGLQWVTIPVARESVHLTISQVLLPLSNWRAKHLKAITLSYAQAPYFQELQQLVQPLYMAEHGQYLVDINRYFITSLSKLLRISTHFVDSRQFQLQGGRVERLVHLLKQVGTRTYITGPSAQEYLRGHEQTFESAGIELRYKSYQGYPSYPQLRAPFEGEVSILDLIANVGIGNAPDYIWGWRKNQ